MDHTAGKYRAHSLSRSLRSRALLLGVACAVTLVGVPAVAQATSRPRVTATGHTTVARTLRSLSSSICNKASASSVSSIIGYKVPSGTLAIFHFKATKVNYETSAVETTCTYGAQANMAEILKAVTLSFEVLSKPITTAEMQASIAKVSSFAKFKFTPYSGLGVPGYYFSLTAAGITGQGITGVLGGTRYFGASVETKTLSKSKLAALAKLAENL
jgi:hypothetical protein